MRVFWIAAGTGALMMLTACAAGPKPDVSIAPKVVTVEVSKPCVPADLAQAPASYPDDALTDATPPDERYLKTAAANQMRKGRLLSIEPVLAACRK